MSTSAPNPTTAPSTENLPPATQESAAAPATTETRSLTQFQDEINELAALLEFMASVIPDGMRKCGCFSEGIMNGFSIILSDAECRGKRLKEWLDK